MVGLDEAGTTGAEDYSQLDLRSTFWMGVRGLEYHRKAIAREHIGRWVWLELVPEPGNPYDDTAVALDLDGVRVGYVGASVAYRMFPVVRYQNLDGSACFVPGVIETIDQAYVVLPTQSRLDQFMDQGVITRELLALWNALSPDVRDEISNSNYWMSDGTGPEVFALRELAPHLDLSLDPQSKSLPWAWDDFMKQKRRVRREERAAEREQEREAAARRIAQREVERRLRDERIVALHTEGLSRAAIAQALDVGVSAVSGTLAKAGRKGTGGMNDFSRSAHAARLERCSMALELQTDGLTRAEIAHSMGISADTVKRLLRDARTRQDP